MLTNNAYTKKRTTKCSRASGDDAMINKKKTGIRILLMICLVISKVAISDSSGGYLLGSGDRVKVTVFGHQDLSGEFQLDAMGRISMPLIRTIDAASLNQADLELLITNRLRPDYLVNPRVSVEILTYRPFYIVGEVRNAGDFPYQADLTVLKAIALAGGFTERANTKKLYITRAKDSEKKKRIAKPDSRVMPGDIITIPQRYF